MPKPDEFIGGHDYRENITEWDSTPLYSDLLGRRTTGRPSGVGADHRGETGGYVPTHAGKEREDMTPFTLALLRWTSTGEAGSASGAPAPEPSVALERLRQMLRADAEDADTFELGVAPSSKRADGKSPSGL